MQLSKDWDALNRQIRATEKAAGMGRDDHINLVRQVTGQESLKGATTAQMQAVLRAVQGKAPKRHRKSAKPYVRKIWALWGELVRGGHIRAADTGQALASYVNERVQREILKPQQIDWLTYQEADKVIEALKVWVANTQKGAAHAG